MRLVGLTLALALCTVGSADDANWPSWRGPRLDATQPGAKNLPSTWSQTENVAWRTPLPSWSAGSPVVWGKTVFVTSAQDGFSNTESGGMLGHLVRGFFAKFNESDDVLLLAIDVRDGSIRWERTVGDGNWMRMKHNQASPSPVTDGERVCVVTGAGVDYLVVSGGGYVTLHNLATGQETARAGGLIPNGDRDYRIVGSPSAVGDVIVAPSRQRPMLGFGVRPGPKLEKLWEFMRGPDIPSPVSDGNRVYVVTDRGVLTVLDPSDGSPIVSPTRLEAGSYTASPVVADGKLFATSEEGATSVVAVSDTNSVLAVNRLEEHTLSTPAVTADKIFIRTAKALYCLEQR